MGKAGIRKGSRNRNYRTQIKVIKDLAEGLEAMLTYPSRPGQLIIGPDNTLYWEDRDKIPPELRHENPVALFGGKGGIKFHTFFAQYCKGILKKEGFLALEFEPFQKPLLEKVFKTQNWEVEFIEDFAGNPRVLVATPI